MVTTGRLRIGEQRLIGRGVAEVDVVGADELDGHARSFAREDAHIEILVFEEALLLRDPDTGMLGPEYPIQPQRHLVLRLCGMERSRRLRRPGGQRRSCCVSCRSSLVALLT